MNDLISRKALIAEYDRVHVGPPGGARKLMEDAPAVDEPHWATEQAYKNGYAKGYADSTERWSKLTNAEMKWIPVSERLPEDLPENKGKKVINCIVAHSPYNNGKLTSQFRQRKWDKRDNKWYWSKIGGSTVTHWMPLPEPPKGE